MKSTYTDYAQVPAPGPWSRRAACRGTHHDFFAEGALPNTIRELCASCPVSRQCLAYAIRHNMHGVWAGTTWTTRRRLRRTA